eukprot:TRINITY_DN192_c0_g1_i1.p1 TRINITY_DN192_c0_g1~~TRINITY_DN192_c0_g1_i1.p1  ORF type:complete len:614 (+),score=59.26 TRINITY_DN192_c0_g1_i1:1075-2916(+)
MSEATFDYKPLKTIANCLKYIEENSLEMSSFAVSPVTKAPSNPILLLNQYNTGNLIHANNNVLEVQEEPKEEAIPELNVSAIVPAGEEMELSCKNAMDPFCESLDEAKGTPKVWSGKRTNNKQSVEEPIIERYSEEGSEAFEAFAFDPLKNSAPRLEPTKVAPLQIPLELMDSSQESLCKTEEKELEAERLNFVKNIEEDLKRRVGPEFIRCENTSNRQESGNTMYSTSKKTARFATAEADVVESKIEKENSGANNAVVKSKAPIKLNLKIGKLCPKKINEENCNERIGNCQEPLTFRGSVETERPMATEKSHSSHKTLTESIEEKKAQMKKYRKQETEEAFALKTMCETLRITKNDPNKTRWLETKIMKSKTKLNQIRANITQLENTVKYMIKLAKEKSTAPICTTSRLSSTRRESTVISTQEQLEKKYSQILRLKIKPSLGHARTSRSYTITEKTKKNQVMSFVSAKGKDTPNFSKSKIARSKIFSPIDSTPTTLTADYYSKNKSHETIRPFQDLPAMFTHQTCKDWNNKSICNPKDAVDLLVEGYQKLHGKKPNEVGKLIKYWKDNVSSKAIVNIFMKKNNIDKKGEECRFIQGQQQQGIVQVNAYGLDK